jgi:hypothetical protein
LWRGWRGRAQVSRSFALGPAALIALFLGGHIKIAPLLHYNILLQDNIFKPDSVPRTYR